MRLFLAILFMFTVAFGQDLSLRTYPVRYNSAASVARLLNDMFGKEVVIEFQQSIVIARPAFRATAEERSNLLLVLTTESYHNKVVSILPQLDCGFYEHREMRMLKLQYVSATEVVPIVISILTQTTPKGFKDKYTTFSNPRTNVLIISGATKSQLDMVERILTKLDVKVPTVSKTLIHTLKNAKVEDMERILRDMK